MSMLEGVKKLRCMIMVKFLMNLNTGGAFCISSLLNVTQILII